MRKLEADVNDSTSAESSKEVELFPGRFERRYLLRGSLKSAAAIMALWALPDGVLAQSPPRASGSAISPC